MYGTHENSQSIIKAFFIATPLTESIFKTWALLSDFLSLMAEPKKKKKKKKILTDQCLMSAC